jgi:hypothetical protein
VQVNQKKEGKMAVVLVSMDTSLSPSVPFSPVGLELISGTLDLLYFVCLRAQTGLLHRVLIEGYAVEIDRIDFSNPIHLWAFFKNVSSGTVHSILDRTVYYRLERERRTLENQKLRQEVIALQLKNAERIPRARRKLIEGGLSEKAAERLLGRLIADQSLTIEVEPPNRRPIRARIR